MTNTAENSPERLTIFGSFTSSSTYKPMLYLSLARLPFSDGEPQIRRAEKP